MNERKRDCPMTSSAASCSLSFSHYFSSLVSSVVVVVVVVDSRHRRWSRRTKLCGPATEFNDMEKPFFHEKNSKSFRHWHYHQRVRTTDIIRVHSPHRRALSLSLFFLSMPTCLFIVEQSGLPIVHPPISRFYLSFLFFDLLQIV